MSHNPVRAASLCDIGESNPLDMNSAIFATDARGTDQGLRFSHCATAFLTHGLRNSRSAISQGVTAQALPRALFDAGWQKLHRATTLLGAAWRLERTAGNMPKYH